MIVFELNVIVVIMMIVGELINKMDWNLIIDVSFNFLK